MNNIERRDQELVYISDDAVFAEQKLVRVLVQKLNTMDRSDFDGIRAVIRELFGAGEDAMVCIVGSLYMAGEARDYFLLN